LQLQEPPLGKRPLPLLVPGFSDKEQRHNEDAGSPPAAIRRERARCGSVEQNKPRRSLVRDIVMATLEEKILNPMACYTSPAEVLIDDGLTLEDKDKVLKAWRLDAEQLAESTNEGMGGGQNPRLRDVALAQHSLETLTKAAV
jgi:hypothetical protein